MPVSPTTTADAVVLGPWFPRTPESLQLLASEIEKLEQLEQEEEMNPLTGILPPKARRVLYAIVVVAGAVFAAWEATEGEWAAFIPAVVAALSALLAGANVTPPDES
jgi:hypothetical protein